MKTSTLIRSAYSPRERLKVDNVSPSRTKQQFKDECDINVIISRFLRSGVMDFTARNEPRYGDVTGIEFQSAMETVARARSLFSELPAQLRNRFENSPAKFLDFVNNPKNREEARELGLLKPEVSAPAVPATPPAPAPSPAPTEAAKPA